MGERGEVSSGLVIAGAYADKLRRALFAQLSPKVKSREISSNEVTRASRELNMFLYHVLVERLGLGKGDVVRIRIGYDVEDGAIRWDYGSLRVEAFRRIPQEEVDRVVKDALEHVEEVVERRLTVEEAGRSPVGDLLFTVKIGDVEVGVLEATQLDDELLVRGALISPEPVIIERTKVELGGRGAREVLEGRLRELAEKGRRVEREEAEEAVRLLSGIARTAGG